MFVKFWENFRGNFLSEAVKLWNGISRSYYTNYSCRMNHKRTADTYYRPHMYTAFCHTRWRNS